MSRILIAVLMALIFAGCSHTSPSTTGGAKRGLSLERLQVQFAVQTLLKKLRKGDADYRRMISEIHLAEIQTHLPLARFGTSPEELEKLRRVGAKVAAEKWLASLRADASGYHFCIAGIVQELREGKWALSDIGTSEGEIAELRTAGAKMLALAALNALRRGSDNYNTLTALLLSEVRDGSLKISDIGTTDEELRRLQSLGAKVAAQKWLLLLRERKGDTEETVSNANVERRVVEEIVSNIRREVRKGDLALREIGTNERELQKYVRTGVDI